MVTVPFTFFATTEAISQVGARFDFVDIDERTYTMDPDKLRAYLETECTRDSTTGRLISKRHRSPVTAVVPVHLYGQMADMDPILELARRRVPLEGRRAASEGRIDGARGGVQLLSGQEPGRLRRGRRGHDRR
jgi:dTDP-4-amino-4,6-dideoxygalactose transaminase